VISFRQIEANRRNALRSTGPITEAGVDVGDFLTCATATTGAASVPKLLGLVRRLGCPQNCLSYQLNAVGSNLRNRKPSQLRREIAY